MAKFNLDNILKHSKGVNRSFVQKAVESVTWELNIKGFGDREKELAFFHRIIKEAMVYSGELHTLSWGQYQDYNDNYNYFSIELLDFNGIEVLNPFDFSDPVSMFNNNDWPGEIENLEEDWDLFLNEKGIPEDEGDMNNKELYSEYQHYLTNKYADLKKGTTVIFVFLAALYLKYGVYYFIYLFGWRSKVTITKQEITIDTSLDSLSEYIGESTSEKFDVE